jgi:hypothetical protein
MRDLIVAPPLCCIPHVARIPSELVFLRAGRPLPGEPVRAEPP